MPSCSREKNAVKQCGRWRGFSGTDRFNWGNWRENKSRRACVTKLRRALTITVVAVNDEMSFSYNARILKLQPMTDIRRHVYKVITIFAGSQNATPSLRPRLCSTASHEHFVCAASPIANKYRPEMIVQTLRDPDATVPPCRRIPKRTNDSAAST